MSVRIDTFSFEEVKDKIRQFLNDDKLHSISTVNPEFVMAAQKDREFLHILNHADINVPDGFGVQLAVKKILGNPCERITGVDLTWAIAELAAEEGRSIFLLGAGEGVAVQAALKLKVRFPDLTIAGCHSGRPDEEGLIDRLNAAEPDILLVAFGAPKQEKFIFHNAARLKARVAMGVGGTFDYIAGIVPRAPAWMRKAGLEWLYRLIKQPERIGRIITATIRFPISSVFYILARRTVTKKHFGVSSLAPARPEPGTQSPPEHGDVPVRPRSG